MKTHQPTASDAITSISASSSYSKIAIAMHWLIALLNFINIAGGLRMETFPKNTPEHDAVLFYHASFGSLIFMFAVLRLIWRALHQPLWPRAAATKPPDNLHKGLITLRAP